MIRGAHFLLYTTDPEADRRFFRDVLGFAGVDAGDGWLIFALPPAELAVHPAEGNFVHRHADGDLAGAVLYLMCDDVDAAVASLRGKGARCADVGQASWGRYTTLALPSGGWVGLYQPSHPVAIRPAGRAR